MNLVDLSRQRWRIAIALSAVVFATYFGFILLIAFDQGFVARLLTPGLSIGILLGALVIIVVWVVTWIYVRWANNHFDKLVAEVRSSGGNP